MKSLVILFWLIIWQVLSILFDSPFFPGILAIASHLFELLSTIEFWSHIGWSGYRLIAGIIVGVPAAVFLAFAVTFNRHIRRVLWPLFALTYPVPKLAIFPLLMVFLGIGDLSKIFIIAVGVFFIVLLSCESGLVRIKSSGLADLASVYRAPQIRTFYSLYWLGIWPDFVNGMKMGIGYGLVMVVASEFTVSTNGVGFYMWNAWDQFQILDLYAGLFVIALCGIILFGICDSLLRRRELSQGKFNE